MIITLITLSLFLCVIPIIFGFKKSMFVIIISLIYFLVFYNVIKVINESYVFLLTMFIIFIVFSGCLLAGFAFKDRVNIKSELKVRIKYSALIAVLTLIFVLSRMWFHHQTSDTLFYISYSNNIFSGKYLSMPNSNRYLAQVNLWVASLFENKGIYFSLITEIMVGFLLSYISIKISEELLKEREKMKIFFSLMFIIISITTIQNFSSASNWIYATIVFLIIVAYRKESIVIIFAPIAFSCFTTSTLLFWPIAFLIVFIINRKLSISAIFLSLISMLAFLIIVITETFNLQTSLLLMLMCIPMGFSMLWIFQDKEVSNPLYILSEKIFAKVPLLKGKEHIFAGIIISFLFIVYVILNVANLNVYNFTTLLHGGSKWTYLVFIISLSVAMIINLISRIVFKVEFKSITIVFDVSMVFIFILYLVTNIVKIHVLPFYIFNRVNSPIIMLSPLIVFVSLFNFASNCFETSRIKKSFAFAVMPILTVAVMYSSIALDVNNDIVFTDKVTNNYDFMSQTQKQIIKQKHKNKKIYSDMPIFLIDGVNSAIGLNDEKTKSPIHNKTYVGRELYAYGDMETTAKWAKMSNYWQDNMYFIWSFEYMMKKSLKIDRKNNTFVSSQSHKIFEVSRKNFLYKFIMKNADTLMIKSKIYQKFIECSPLLKTHFILQEKISGIAIYNIKK